VITGRYDEQTLQRALSSIALPSAEIASLIQSCKQANCTFGNLKASDIGNNRDAIKLHALAEAWQDIPAGQEYSKQNYMEKVVKLLQFHLDKRDMKHAEAIGKVIGARNWESLGESIKKLAASLDGRKKRNDDTEPKLTLITMHSSKGLQFDNVWITCAEDGGIPSKEALAEGKEEEERRLLYVAMTRAIYNLHISYAVSPSMFLYEIDEERVHELESNEVGIK
jgi:superfamily I DNA/RNA helicase